MHVAWTFVYVACKHMYMWHANMCIYVMKTCHMYVHAMYVMHATYMCIVAWENKKEILQLNLNVFIKMHIFKLLSIYVSFRKVGKDLILPSSQNRLPLLNNVRKCERCESATIYICISHTNTQTSQTWREKELLCNIFSPPPHHQ